MDRTNGAGHVNHLFAAENLATGRPPTEVTAEWLNGVQEEIANVIEGAGIPLNPLVNTQLRTAIASRQPVNVKDFGAKGDGITDDTLAIQAAINATQGTGKSLHLPGTTASYLITATLNISAGIRIYGDGCSVVTNGGTQTGSILYFNHLGKGFNVSGANNIWGVWFEDLATKRNQAAPAAGWTPIAADYDIYLDSTADCTIRDVMLINPTNGIYLGGANPGRLNIDGLKGQPLQVGIKIETAYDVCRIENVHFWPFWQDNAAFIHAYTLLNLRAFWFLRCDNPLIANCFSIFAAFGFVFSSGANGITSKAHITNSDMDLFGRNAVVIEAGANGVTLQLNNFTAQGQTPSTNTSGIYVAANNCAIEGSNIRLTNLWAQGISFAGTGCSLDCTTLQIEAFNLSNTGLAALAMGTGNALKNIVITPELFGAVGDGVVDDTRAVQAALNAVGALGGGQVRAAKRYLIDQALSIPNNVHLMGVLARPGETLPGTSANYSAGASVLTVNAAITITTGHCSSVSGLVVMRKGLSLPFADAATATAGLAAFAGVPFTVGGFDNKFADLLVLGFNQVISSINQSRIVCDRVYGDNNNGIYIQGCWDIARIDNCHFWPFTTAHQAWTSNALLRRPGHAYEMVNGGDWNKLTDSFSYGYNWGTAIRSCNNVMVVGGGADNTSTAGIGDHPGSFGLLIDGSSRQTHVLGFTSAAQAQGYYLNTLAGCQTQIRDCDGHGMQGAIVYVNSGDVVINGNFMRSAQNAITVNNAASLVDIDDNQFDVIAGVVINAAVASTNVRIGDRNQYGNTPINSTLLQNLNAVPSIATASTLALPTRGNTFMLTGSVSFGSMGGNWPEREVMLIASAPVIALHSLGVNGLCLKAKANLTLAINDTLVLRHNGFQWYQI